MRVISRWSVPAITVSAAFLLSACTGGSTVPGGPGNEIPSASQRAGDGLTAFGARSDAACPKKFTAGCFTFSLSKGLRISWCYGPSSDQCSTTQDYTWSGDVCSTKAKDCDAIEPLRATWSGPYKCKVPKTCQSKGYYELDTITKGKKPPKPTKLYVYKQQVSICSASCVTYYIGINVGK
ncbi:MAG: hypothetical protein JO078_02800 [Candidatus Eremiobacteraeota bacterium]|nr:hypothetical protein [Candidatus Eremiobacteraeota bacterium]MBV9699034.1 hypothetical protein [Candidatus Eremiobacteraeota bacterium]